MPNPINKKMSSSQLIHELGQKNNRIQKNSTNQNHSNVQANSFGELLKAKTRQTHVIFSKHANHRLDERSIDLSAQEIDRLEKGVLKAKSKGVREALIIMDNKCFIANVNKHTIITAAVDDQLKDSVFTNIDGAVIV